MSGGDNDRADPKGLSSFDFSNIYVFFVAITDTLWAELKICVLAVLHVQRNGMCLNTS